MSNVQKQGRSVGLENLQEQLLAARKSAVSQPRPVQEESPDWPDPLEVTWEEASTLLGIEVYLNGAKLGLGITADGQSIWGRIGYPKWSMNSELAGMSALTFGSEVDRVLRKLCQLKNNPAAAKFKPDPYAK